MKIKVSILIVLLVVISCSSPSGKKSIIVDNTERTYTLHLPKSFDSQQRYPLVIVLHGRGGDSQRMEDVSGMSQKADKEGFIVVYPEGLEILRGRRSWNANFCCGEAYVKKINDVQFISTLIDTIAEEYNIDEKRVYVTGISNGGRMTYELAASLPLKIAAAAPIAANVGRNDSRGATETITIPSAPVPLLIFHGKEDPVTPYEGGPSEEDPTILEFSVDDSLQFWKEVNGCSGSEIITFGNIQVEGFKNCDAEIILYTINNGGHTWPGSSARFTKESGFVSNEISATDLMWEFFKRHPKS